MVDNKFPLIEKARAWFHRQPSAQQKNIKKYGTIGTFVIIALGIYYLTGQDKKKPVEPPKQTDVAEAKTSSYVQDDIVSTLGGQIKDLKSGIDTQVKDAVADAMAKGQFSLTPPPAAVNTNTPAGSSQTAPSENAQSPASGNAADGTGMLSYPTPAAYTDPSSQGGKQDSGNGEEP
ncbi:conjugal transfer protein TraB, partial [Enterobacter hormaechei]|nr:conjugal transfer protein TraB [Enterobacter hormaechei]